MSFLPACLMSVVYLTCAWYPQRSLELRVVSHCAGWESPGLSEKQPALLPAKPTFIFMCICTCLSVYVLHMCVQEPVEVKRVVLRPGGVTYF